MRTHRVSMQEGNYEYGMKGLHSLRFKAGFGVAGELSEWQSDLDVLIIREIVR